MKLVIFLEILDFNAFDASPTFLVLILALPLALALLAAEQSELPNVLRIFRSTASLFNKERESKRHQIGVAPLTIHALTTESQTQRSQRSLYYNITKYKLEFIGLSINKHPKIAQNPFIMLPDLSVFKLGPNLLVNPPISGRMAIILRGTIVSDFARAYGMYLLRHLDKLLNSDSHLAHCFQSFGLENHTAKMDVELDDDKIVHVQRDLFRQNLGY
mmetsp:Transcript_12364/g.21126  ORF Transcript_12364/g.21126 Transcript_12364/m.21126 type:complete len:216 (-) Transcript_12364:775-1422(-)